MALKVQDVLVLDPCLVLTQTRVEGQYLFKYLTQVLFTLPYLRATERYYPWSVARLEVAPELLEPSAQDLRIANLHLLARLDLPHDHVVVVD